MCPEKATVDMSYTTFRGGWTQSCGRFIREISVPKALRILSSVYKHIRTFERSSEVDSKYFLNPWAVGLLELEVG